jgi:ABC-type transport system involved in multi-copper enzyme maturation permease subunit
MMNLFRITAIAVRELVYERAFYLLLAFAILSLGLSLMLGQLTYTEQSKLTLDFMLAGMEISMVLFAVFAGIGLFQRELTMGSVSMTLAKPISRYLFLLGKFLGQMVVQTIIILAMTVMTYLVCYPDGSAPLGSLAQTVTLILFEVTVITAMTYAFAVNSGGVTTAVSTLCLFCLGHLRETLSENINSRDPLYFIWKVATTLIPNLELFNTKNLASYGATLPPSAFGWATLYMFCCVAFYLLIASITFERRDILT